MTDSQFRAEIRATIEAFKRKIARLEAVGRGERTMRRVWRKGYNVRAHAVSGHHMLVTCRAAAK